MASKSGESKAHPTSHTEVTPYQFRLRMTNFSVLNVGHNEAEVDDTSDSLADANEDSRVAGFVSRASKRRKLTAQSSRDEFVSDNDERLEWQDVDDASGAGKDQKAIVDGSTPQRKIDPTVPPSEQSKSKTSSAGIVYISRIPPYLKPHTLRQMISVHGPVTNLFLTPEPPSAYHTRVRVHHGNKKRQYIDGWVEFKHKRHAKACVDALNGRTSAEGMGVGTLGSRKGGKGRWYRDDVWSLRYLRGFSWDDLMQSARMEEREREERVRLGVMKEKKERQAFLAGVQNAKIDQTRQKKRKRKLIDGQESQQNIGTDVPELEQHTGVPERSKQRENGNDEVRSVLSKIF